MSRTGTRVTWRLMTLVALLSLAALVMVFRLIQIQAFNHDHYLELAQDRHFETRDIQPARGALLDRNGFPLATSVDVFDLYVDRRAWRDVPSRMDRTAAGLAPVLEKPEAEILARLSDDSEGPITLLETGLEFETGRIIEGLHLPGVTLAAATKRFYPEGDLASGLLGFLGRDHTGLAGLEADFDDTLGGVPGRIFFERDGGGQPIAFGQSSIEPGVPGSDVRLTIDRYIQQLIETELDRRIEMHNAAGGTILVMDPATGAILGMASRPSYNISELATNPPGIEAYRNRAVTDLYEPGSVVKVLTMATAIDQGLVTPHTTFYDNGILERDGYVFRNWDYSANGVQTMTELLQKSLNTGSIWLSDLIGADLLYQYFERYGFGESTFSGLGGESPGLVRTHEHPDWTSLDLATNSYGQGIAATPLQVLSAFASVVNGGKLMRPYIVEEISGPEGRRVYDPVVAQETISPEASAIMREMLHDTVDGVDYHLAQVPGYNVGGKTGTTLVSIPTGYDLDTTLASFAGFAPVEDPAFVILVKIDEPQDDSLGGAVAAPVFGELAPQILAYLNIGPSQPFVQADR